MITEVSKIIANYEIAEGMMLMTVEASELAKIVEPGQFAMLKVSSSLDPILRRPLCFYTVSKHNGWVEFVYKVIGKGTEALAERKPGEYIDILAPLGEGWTILPDTKQIAIVGRGVGIAPLIDLAKYARQKDLQVKAYLSASRAEFLVGKDLLEEIGCDVYLHTDDGQYGDGYKVVTDYLEKTLETERIDQVFTCGSKRLGKKVLEYSKTYDMNSQISLEERMGCGIGACVGCVVDIITNRGEGVIEQQRVCKEGPVFWVEEVAMLNEA